MKINLKNLTGIMALLLMAGCDNSDGSEKNSYKPVDLPGETRAVVEDVNDFAFRINSELVSSLQEMENIVFSPQSLFSTLAMVVNGQNEVDRESILDVLAGGKKTLGQLNEYCKAMVDQLPGLDRQVCYREVNSVWFGEDQTVFPGFRQAVMNYYDADLFTDTNLGEAGRDAINNWVKKNTDGLVPWLLEDPVDKLPIFVNTLYFKAEWQEKFKKQNTNEAVFHNLRGRDSKVEMMHNTISSQYYRSEEYEMGILPYGSGNFEMCVIHPFDYSGFKQFTSGMTTEKLNQAINESKECMIRVSLPKFEIDSYGAKIPVSCLVGQNSIVAEDIIEGARVKISQLIHKVTVIVNEEGTEVSASTATSDPTSVAPADLNVDSPFIVVVREKSTGAILMFGNIVEL